MNCEKYINYIWDKAEPDEIKASEITVYTYFLHKCSTLGKNPFEISIRRITFDLPLSRQTIDVSIKRLAEIGLIKFSKGEKRLLRKIEINEIP